MTERVLPAIAIPAPRPVVGAPAGPAVRPRAAAPARLGTAQRREVFLTTPARAGMLLGCTAAVYAVTLAAVSGLQASSDAAIAAARRPYLDQVDGIRGANDALEDALVRAGADAAWLASEYDEVSADVTAYQARLDSLAALVAEVEGSAAALPDRISLPKMTLRGSIGTVRSTPSGGSSGGSSGAPSSNGSSGGSGG